MGLIPYFIQSIHIFPYAHIYEYIVTKLFFNQELHDFSKSGVNIECQDGMRATIFADLYLILADEAALHAIYGCKGSSGLKPCLLCTNVFGATNPRGIVSRDPTGRSVDHTCASVKQFRLGCGKGKLKINLKTLLLENKS